MSKLLPWCVEYKRTFIKGINAGTSVTRSLNFTNKESAEKWADGVVAEYGPQQINIISIVNTAKE